MNNARRLTLRRESLAPLTGDDLAAVAGGSHECPTRPGCETLTHGPSLDEPCPTPTLPVLNCVRTLNPVECPFVTL